MKSYISYNAKSGGSAQFPVISGSGMEVINALCGARETFVMLPVFFYPAGGGSAFDIFSGDADEFPVPAVL